MIAVLPPFTQPLPHSVPPPINSFQPVPWNRFLNPFLIKTTKNGTRENDWNKNKRSSGRASFLNDLKKKTGKRQPLKFRIHCLKTNVIPLPLSENKCYTPSTLWIINIKWSLSFFNKRFNLELKIFFILDLSEWEEIKNSTGTQ